MTYINMWGPAIIVCLTIILGIFYQNKRFDDFKDAINKRFDDMRWYMDQKFSDIERRFIAVEKRLEKIEGKLENKVVTK